MGNFQRLLLLFLPGLAPLLVFVFISELWGDLAGLAAGVLLGLGEFVFLLIRRRKADLFVLLDLGLLVALGAVSILLADEVFFKLKPVFTELILVVFIV